MAAPLTAHRQTGPMEGRHAILCQCIVMTVEGLLAPIKELSSDAYAGRLPGTDGETKSVAYLIAEAKKMGLQPGAPDGTWTQTVPLWGTKSKGVLTFSAKSFSAKAGQDYVA